METIARRLVEAGLTPWLDTWNLVPGELWQEAIEEALDACQTVAVFLGPSGIGSWENQEMRSALSPPGSLKREFHEGTNGTRLEMTRQRS